MPDGVTHMRKAMLAIPVIVAIAIRIVGGEGTIILVTALVFGELFFSPDLDHGAGALPYKMWGPLKIFWLPYQELFKHRGVSHWPLLGTLTRLLWLLWVPLIVITLSFSWPETIEFFTPYRFDLAMIVVGLELSALMHILADRT